jgi:hypothetical protein
MTKKAGDKKQQTGTRAERLSNKFFRDNVVPPTVDIKKDMPVPKPAQMAVKSVKPPVQKKGRPAFLKTAVVKGPEVPVEIKKKTVSQPVAPPVTTMSAFAKSIKRVIKPVEAEPEVVTEVESEPEPGVVTEVESEPEPEVVAESEPEPEVVAEAESEPEVVADVESEPDVVAPVKPMVVVSLNTPDNPVDNAIYIPISDYKEITGNDVGDDILIEVATKINELSATHKVCIMDTGATYNQIIQDLSNALNDRPFNKDKYAGSFVAEIMERRQ